MSTYHTSVLLKAAVDGLLVEKGKKYIDATLGGGGHTEEIVRRGGIVLGIDTDEYAIGFVKDKIKTSKLSDKQVTLAKGNFRDLERIGIENGFTDVAGILFDLGVSSYQFDTTERGFSFLREATLDMRMDRELTVTAKDLVNGLTKHELSELFVKLGEERFAKKIAEAIVREREKRPIETTAGLAKIIRHNVPGGAKGVHPATRVFQALRIAVNDELNALREALPQAVKLLTKGGRIAVISFHSLEDRIVKQAFLLFAAEELGYIITRKPLIPSEEEAAQNPRSRSAKLRIFEKL
jgi:16S rRNA (cytosine1402-N4)-methyltransferase